MCDPISWALLGTSIATSVAGGVTSKVMKDRAERKMREAHKQLEIQQKAVADRNAQTAETINDNAATNTKRNLGSLLVPLLKTQGTGNNIGEDVGYYGLNLGGNQ